MYKIYAIRLRSKGSQALEETKTLTYSPEAALAGWRYAYDLPLSSEHILLLTGLSYLANSMGIAFPRFWQGVLFWAFVQTYLKFRIYPPIPFRRSSDVRR